ncbi:biotin--[acetyl-CoA-carboxylase] ligase [Kaistella sp. G5-32]|uniref:Biotin--[acetyl-CoA-carboxylase] ligase n=1 Tax=Kaistella gelatinilytica TaxID=2787636 RepID=A0ABS0FDM3_9FLAO|nr:biotin--[acetyl-CoA-carboxylase] ligase [Kaistella gelatinilytica]MBF8457827.1 biotin--[acetyl-CoA-carboxylase] ligase [Kaistella gelatinilytica]
MASIIYLNECGSTNDEILHFLPAEPNELLSVYTFKQTKGKGQYGNSWQSSENLNLAFTIAVPSSLIKLQDHLFNFYTALTLADFLAIMTKSVVEIKWPNDLIIKNKKIAGLLIEKKNIGGIPYFIIGIGLNVLQEKFENLTRAGSLLTQTGLKFNLNEFTEALNEYFLIHLMKEVSEHEVLTGLNGQLFRKDQISVFDIEGLRQNGIIKEVDKDGFLWIELENKGLQKFYHKEIELLY